MIYNNFGACGLKVSAISLGTAGMWQPGNEETDTEIVKFAFESGINFFDSAEVYGGGKSEQSLGKILKKLNIERQRIVVATKIWVAPDSDRNSAATTNKKHVKESIKGSLKRLQMDYVDILFAHGYDFDTPMEQICQAFHEVIEDGDAFYWATSNWEPYKVIEALTVCEKNNYHKPIGTQSSYNMLTRSDIQSHGYQKVFKNFKYGLSCWSPLAGGFLTGKYLDGIKEGQICRLNDSSVVPIQRMRKIYHQPYAKEETISKLKEIEKIAKQQLNCTLTQLSLAWILKNKYVSTAVCGFRNKQQLESNLQALKYIQLLTPELEGKINKILDNHPEPLLNWKSWQKYPTSRPLETQP